MLLENSKFKNDKWQMGELKNQAVVILLQVSIYNYKKNQLLLKRRFTKSMYYKDYHTVEAVNLLVWPSWIENVSIFL